MRLLTPYGVARANVDFEPKPADSCEKPEKKKDEEDGPTVSSFTPTSFSAPGLTVFEFKGEKLDQITAVTLNTQPGKVEPIKGGKTLKATFTRDLTESLPVSRTVPLVLSKGDTAVVTKTVEVTANNGGN